MDKKIEDGIRELVAYILECDPKDIGLKDRFIKDLKMGPDKIVELVEGIERIYCIVIPDNVKCELFNIEESARVVGKILGK